MAARQKPGSARGAERESKQDASAKPGAASGGELPRRLLTVEDLVALTGYQKSIIYEWMNLPLTDPLRLPWVRKLGGRRVKYEDFAAWYDRLESE